MSCRPRPPSAAALGRCPSQTYTQRPRERLPVVRAPNFTFKETLLRAFGPFFQRLRGRRFVMVVALGFASSRLLLVPTSSSLPDGLALLPSGRVALVLDSSVMDDDVCGFLVCRFSGPWLFSALRTDSVAPCRA